mgnify:CR=1 FL=1
MPPHRRQYVEPASLSQRTPYLEACLAALPPREPVVGISPGRIGCSYLPLRKWGSALARMCERGFICQSGM